MSKPTTSDTPSGQSLPSGSRLEEFVIELVLGSGGFGITYLARDSRLGRQVVIKENLPTQFCWRETTSLTVQPRHSKGEDADNFQYSLESFEREASTLASLDHPGIVKVLRSFEAHGTAYFVMPFVEGTALDEVLRQRTEQRSAFTENEIRDLLLKVLDALGYLHDRGIYHRDIKPGNILMTTAGPVLIDFGAARQRLSERSLTVIESAGYTPFEQLQSRGKVGPWSDIYALGGTLYKVITGETPAKANDRIMDDPQVLLAQRAELRGHYSPRLLESIDQAMAPRAADRFQDTAQWRDGLGPSKAATPPTHEPAVTLPPVPVVHTPSGNSLHDERERILAEAAAATIILALLVLGGLAGLVIRNERIEKETTAAEEKQRQMTAQLERERVIKEEEMKRQTSPSDAAGFTNSLGMKFVPVLGTEVMFCIHETRNADYAAYSESSSGVVDTEWKANHTFGKDRHPVVSVSWEDATAFCQWLSKKEGKSYRLPTDHEWSCAVGIGSWEDESASPASKDGEIQEVHPWEGDYPPGPKDGNYAVSGVDDGYNDTAPVMQFKANELGLYDLGGNVWEWCEDWYHSVKDSRVLRGGSWCSVYRDPLASSYRGRSAPVSRSNGSGFRVVVMR
jgi:serine/threonine protein kinase